MSSDGSLARTQWTAEIALMVLASVAVALRIVARAMVSRGLHADDYTLLLTFAIFLATCSWDMYLLQRNELAAPLGSMTYDQLVVWCKAIYGNAILGYSNYGLVKVSVALFYKTIFIGQTFTVCANVYMGVVAAWTVAAIFTHAFSSDPVSAWWTPFTIPDREINYSAFASAMAATDAALDIIVVCMPLFVISKLQMRSPRKIQITCIFALGFFCIAATIVRFYYSLQLNGIDYVTDPAASEIITWNNIWGVIEMGSSIITACLPTMAPLFTGRMSKALLDNTMALVPVKQRQASCEGRKASSHGSSTIVAVDPAPRFTWFKDESHEALRSGEARTQDDPEAQRYGSVALHRGFDAEHRWTWRNSVVERLSAIGIAR